MRRDKIIGSMPVARLKPDVTVAQAQVEMDVIARQLEQAYPATNQGIGKKVQPLHEALFGWARQPLYPLLGAVAFVLLIACGNVANLLQSRTETRRNEYAVRASLGASRRRLIQQLFAESGLLALPGAVLGVALAHCGIQIFRALVGEFPGAESISIDAHVLVFTLAISLLTAFLFGLLPALQASNPDLNNTLRESGRTAAGSRGITRHALAVSEVALAMLLLIGAGLLINSILRMQRVNPGFDSRNLLTIGIQLPEGGQYMHRVPGGDMEQAIPAVNAFYKQLLERVAALPGVESVGSITGLSHAGRLDLQMAVDRLPKGCKKVFLLHDVQGYQHNEIAKLLAISIGASKSQLHKARKRLRSVLRKWRHRPESPCLERSGNVLATVGGQVRYDSVEAA